MTFCYEENQSYARYVDERITVQTPQYEETKRVIPNRQHSLTDNFIVISTCLEVTIK